MNGLSHLLILSLFRYSPVLTSPGWLAMLRGAFNPTALSLMSSSREKRRVASLLCLYALQGLYDLWEFMSLKLTEPPRCTMLVCVTRRDPGVEDSDGRR